MEANGLSLARNQSKTTRFTANTDVEELEPNVDATPVLLICANYRLASTGANHKSAVLYRLRHMDLRQGPRPIDRVTGDVPAEALQLEELGRYAR